jgi:hypothetical protein
MVAFSSSVRAAKTSLAPFSSTFGSIKHTSALPKNMGTISVAADDDEAADADDENDEAAVKIVVVELVGGAFITDAGAVADFLLDEDVGLGIVDSRDDGITLTSSSSSS